MKLFLSILTYSVLALSADTTSNFERSRLDPTQGVPTLDGTQVPVEDFNTAPAPVPEFEEESLPGTIVPAEEAKQRPQKRKEKKKLRRDRDGRGEA